MEKELIINGFTFIFNEEDEFYECKGRIHYNEEGVIAPEPLLWKAGLKLEQQLKEAKQRSEDLNNDLIELAQKKTKYIRGRTEYITQYIDQNLGQYDERFSKNGICAIPQEFVNAHNKAARKPETK